MGIDTEMVEEASSDYASRRDTGMYLNDGVELIGLQQLLVGILTEERIERLNERLVVLRVLEEHLRHDRNRS